MEVLEEKIDFSKFTVVDGIVSASEKKSLINFFNDISIHVEDITSETDKQNNQKVVRVKYSFNNKEFTTKPLYYKNVLNSPNVKDAKNLISYFEDDVFWLDIEKHDWPKPKGQTDIDKLIIDDITDDDQFKHFLKSLGNNLNNGAIQKITKEGRTNQYYRNLENNNHWHDIILLIKEYIKSNGEDVEKKHFKHLVFKWDGNKNTDRQRSSLSPYFGSRALIEKLKENIKSYKSKDLFRIEKMKPIIDLLKYKKQIILQGPPGTGKTREAKLIAKIILDVSDLKNLEQFKLIQFHPSYSYEDFVRGISSKPNDKGNGIEYSAENRILGDFAKIALENFIDSRKDSEELSKDLLLKQYFNDFVDSIQDNINSKGSVELTDSYKIIDTEEAAFRYLSKRNEKKSPGNRMLFKDILNAFSDGNKERQDLKHNDNLSGLAKHHASYYVRVLNMFQSYLEENKLNFDKTITEKVSLKNYVLIIDEINRANLSSVLGELIYALEYRGESVESMYEVDGENKIILPPNLYIIGTMNTADRSVGHIDYAIRRRFAFVDILPKDLSEEEGINFDKQLFEKVTQLFDNNLSQEFKKKDVQLGHSYFINKIDQEDGIPMYMRLEYEIKPILLEYVKDGVLIGEKIEDKINDLNASI